MRYLLFHFYLQCNFNLFVLLNTINPTVCCLLVAQVIATICILLLLRKIIKHIHSRGETYVDLPARPLGICITVRQS